MPLSVTLGMGTVAVFAAILLFFLLVAVFIGSVIERKVNGHRYGRGAAGRPVTVQKQNQKE